MRIFSTLCLILAMVNSSRAEESRQPGALEAAALLQDIDQRMAQLSSLQYRVEKSYSGTKQKTREAYHFIYQAPASFHIAFSEPQPREIFLTDKQLIEYLPSGAAAMQTTFKGMKSEARQALISSILSRSAVEGLRAGNTRDMVQRIQAVTSSPEKTSDWIIQGRDPAFTLKVDSERKVLLSTELLSQEGQLIMRSRSSGLREVAPGFWMPTQIDVSYPAEQELLESRTVLSDIKINASIPEARFTFNKPRGVKILKP